MQLFHSTFQGGARGVAVLVDGNVSFALSSGSVGPGGGCVVVAGSLCSVGVVLANICAPGCDDQHFFARVLGRMPCLGTHALIMGGDFGLCLDPGMGGSSVGPGCAVSRSASCLQSFLSTCGVSDVWHFLHPQGGQCSFFSGAHRSCSRVDYFFLRIAN